MAALGGGGVGCFNVARNSYHVTVFFLSLPTDPVTDPVSRLLPSPATPGKPWLEPDHRREEDIIDSALRKLGHGTVELEVDRIIMAPSGTLLLLFRDAHGTLASVRSALQDAFPAAPAKQTSIAHCTLLRAFPDENRAVDPR